MKNWNQLVEVMLTMKSPAISERELLSMRTSEEPVKNGMGTETPDFLAVVGKSRASEEDIQELTHPHR